MNIPTLLHMFAILHQLRGHDHWTRQRLEAYQRRRLRELRDYAYQHSPFYQRFHRGLYDAPLEQLPVLTKGIMMENFDELVTDRAVHLDDMRLSMKTNPDAPYLGRYWISCTSGSSGKPGIFLYSKPEWVTVMASFARGQDMAGVTINPFSSHRFAFVLSPMSHHMSNRVGVSMRSPWARLLYLSASESLQHIVEQLNAWQPEVFGTYASKAGELALEQIAHRLQIHPRWVFTSAELLTPECRQLIQQAWGIQPFNEYGATETAVIAAECTAHSGLHAYEDLLILENVNDQNRPVSAGTYGAKLLVTVLFNRTQPLIRYELDDSLVMSEEPCVCGRPYARITSIQGRQMETLYMLSEDGSVIPIHPVVLIAAMEEVEVGSWQIIQRDDGLHVQVTGLESETAQLELEDALRLALTAAGVHAPGIFVEPVVTIARAPSGKLALIKRETR